MRDSYPIDQEGISVNHWPLFTEFVQEETAVGGPDAQLSLLVHLGKDAPIIEQVWLIGCYCAHHCVPSAWAVWKEFRPEELRETDERLHKWLAEHWDALPVRPEMRSHRMLEKRARCLEDFAHYALDESWTKGNYDDVWHDSIESVKYYNRYMAIKMLELLRRVARPDLALYDVRAKNAWSPRITIGMLWPEVNDIVGDRDNNSDKAIALAEEYATKTIQELANRNVNISYFQLQVMLCNYRELLNGGYFPGASNYEEILYIDQTKNKFDMEPVYQARKEIFKPECLGECHNWDKDLKTLTVQRSRKYLI